MSPTDGAYIPKPQHFTETSITKLITAKLCVTARRIYKNGTETKSMQEKNQNM